MRIKLLYPSDYFGITSVDSDYKDEYEAACNFPEFDIVLYDYDEFVSTGKLISILWILQN